MKYNLKIQITINPIDEHEGNAVIREIKKILGSSCSKWKIDRKGFKE